MWALSGHCQCLNALKRLEGITEKHKNGSGNGSRQAVATLLHGKEHHRHGHSSKHCGHRAERNIRNAIRNVRVSDVLKLEVTIVANEPAHEGEQELSERRVDIEEVSSLQVLQNISTQCRAGSNTE
jgi:hypothetical protein